jgi:RNA polymerase sigma-70 factor (ECF subfamily)
MDRLISLLSSDVLMHTDGGGKAAALVLPIYGPDKVARAAVYGLRRLLSLNVLQRIVEVNGQPGIVSYQDGGHSRCSPSRRGTGASRRSIS